MTSVWMHLAPHIKDIEHAAMRYVYGWKLSSRDLAGMKDAALREISGYMSRFDEIKHIDDIEGALACAIAYEHTHGDLRTGYARILKSAVEEIDEATGEPLGTVASLLEKAVEIWK